jgi:hypothetical protein
MAIVVAFAVAVGALARGWLLRVEVPSSTIAGAVTASRGIVLLAAVLVLTIVAASMANVA